MCRPATVPGAFPAASLTLLGVLAAASAAAQPQTALPSRLLPDWRPIGSSTYEIQLPSPATGPVQQVWFSLDGSAIYVQLSNGRTFRNGDLESWQPAPDSESSPPLPPTAFPASLPEPGAVTRPADSFQARLYAFGRQVYRSDDGGWSWDDRTSWRGSSILGSPVHDLAVHPFDPDLVVAVNEFGVWRSVDGGLSWHGLNEGLPNLPVRRLVAAPAGARGIKIQLDSGAILEWLPGGRCSWLPADDAATRLREAAQHRASEQTGQMVTAMVLAGEYGYAGSSDGTLWVSRDGGQSWHWSRRGAGIPVLAVQAVPDNPARAFAAFGKPIGSDRHPAVLYTIDGGVNWSDISGDLPAGSVYGIATDGEGAAVYAATESGLYLRVAADAFSAPGGRWVSLSGNLPPAPVRDVRLDEEGHQVFAALEGYGVYAAPAPHRLWRVEVASAADLSSRPAAPGSLLTVLGGRLIRAQAGLLPAPVLFASESQSQLQVPFEVTGPSTELALDLAQGRFIFRLPLAEASPAIFVDPEGAAMLMDGDTGVLLDASHPARPGMRIQMLATGLGRVAPAWRTGVAAPLQEPPRVLAPVRAYLNGAPVEVTRATLAPGYIGFYLVELLLPPLLDPGPSELFLEAMGRYSNRVRLWVEP
ncbi:MAG: hypothetical protein ACUVXB_09145 [Bryobacteraceae bacterium]